MSEIAKSISPIAGIKEQKLTLSETQKGTLISILSRIYNLTKHGLSI